MRKMFSCLCLLLACAGPSAQARRILSTPVPIGPEDRRSILVSLEVEDSQLLVLRGYQLQSQDATNSPTYATVAVLLDEIAAGIQVAEVITCVTYPAEWTCRTEMATEVLIVALPRFCGTDRTSHQAKPYFLIEREDSLPVSAVEELAGFICTSEDLFEKAWSTGHKIGGIRRNVDGYLELTTIAPESDDHGFCFVLDENCENGICQFSIHSVINWIT